jgi:hypothetical protein
MGLFMQQVEMQIQFQSLVKMENLLAVQEVMGIMKINLAVLKALH